MMRCLQQTADNYTRQYTSLSQTKSCCLAHNMELHNDGAAGLPVELVARIVSCLPLKFRASNCALVNPTAVKAADAPAELRLTALTSLSKQVKACLQLYGSCIVKLRLEGAPWQRLELTSKLSRTCTWQHTPFLQELHLRQFVLQFTADQACGWQGALHGVSHLRKLSISSSTALGGDVAPVAALTALEHLSFDWSNGASAHRHNVRIAGDFVNNLQRLSHLQLFDCKIEDGVLQQLSRLQELHVLGFDAQSTSSVAVEGVSSACFSKLTHLTLRHLDSNQDSAAELVSAFVAAVPGLQHICLPGRWTLQPQLLAPLTRLQQLDLGCESAGSGGQQQHRTPAFLLQLLELVHNLHVRVLKLNGRLQHVPGLQSPSLLQYGVLTACSRLQQLYLHGCTLPQGAFLSMFPAGRFLPDLEVLVLHDTQQEVLYHSHWVQFTSCCPNLHTLAISIGQQPGYELYALQSLTQLRQLSVAGAGLGDAALSLVLPTLSSLTGLQLLSPNTITWRGIQELKRATFLSTLEVFAFVAQCKAYMDFWLAGDGRVSICCWLDMPQQCTAQQADVHVVFRALGRLHASRARAYCESQHLYCVRKSAQMLTPED